MRLLLRLAVLRASTNVADVSRQGIMGEELLRSTTLSGPPSLDQKLLLHNTVSAQAFVVFDQCVLELVLSTLPGAPSPRCKYAPLPRPIRGGMHTEAHHTDGTFGGASFSLEWRSPYTLFAIFLASPLSASEEFSQVSQDKSPNDYVDLSAEEDEEEDEATLWDSVRELASDRRAQGTAALTLGGYVTVGVVGGTSGLVTGGTVGTVLGLGPALVTAGLSVPVGAVVGACTGLCVGASAGAATGAAAGFFLGRRAFYRSPDRLQSTVEVTEAAPPAPEPFDHVLETEPGPKPDC
ncbi:rsph1 [Symbiodinium sp. CCMP2592]|nr:rsph1 [Symbiodinium sp. CCMP2592]